MAKKMEWGNFPEQRQFKKTVNKDGTPMEPRRELSFITLGKKAIGKTYNLRPVGSFVGYWKYIVQRPDGKWRSAVLDLDVNPQELSVYAKHTIMPKETFAINVIDRADGQIKILEAGRQIFQEFQKYQKATEKSPGGPNGADFKLQVTGQKGPNYYKMELEKKTPLTASELELLKKDGLFKLENIFKPVEPDKVEETLYGDGPVKSDNAVKPKVSTPAKPSVEDKNTDIDSFMSEESSEESSDSSVEEEINF